MYKRNTHMMLTTYVRERLFAMLKIFIGCFPLVCSNLCFLREEEEEHKSASHVKDMKQSI